MNHPDVVVFVPCVIESEANSREHWARKAKRVKAQRNAARVVVTHGMHRFAWAVIDYMRSRTARVQLHVTRARKLDDDNLVSGLKAVRDGIADAFGRSDSASDGLRFLPPSQSSTKDKSKHGVLVSVWLETGPTVAL